MKKTIKIIFKKFLGENYYKLSNYYSLFMSRFGKRSYSQEGEDLILSRILDQKRCGFYVDVGAHHPHRFSNTYLFYRQGWRGINIDAMPGSMKPFKRYRPRDVNLEVGVLDKRGEMPFFIFNEPALNGFWPDEETAKAKNPGYQIVDVKSIPVFPLSEILLEHLPEDQSIDFLTVDAEGRDYEVLSSNDWNAFSPNVVAVEVFGKDIKDLLSSQIGIYMAEVGYVLFSKSFNTVFFIKAKFLKMTG